MGDPLSAASGVAGLISLGLTVCDGLHTYFGAIRARKDDIASAIQSLALLKFHVFAVQSSASKLGHCHSPAIDGLQLSLINCEMQLKCLDSLLDELMPFEYQSRAKEIWRRQKLIVRYPFDRKKLVQVEEYLSRANSTISSFIQALNLDINIRMMDNLDAFKVSLQALDVSTQTTLKTIATRLEAIGPGEETSTTESAIVNNSSVVLQQVAVGSVERNTSLNRKEASLEDLTEARFKPGYLQNAELERRLCNKLAMMDCTCGVSNGHFSRRPASHMYRFWGGLTVSRQGDVRLNHRPGCIFFQRSSRNVSRTSLTYTGLLSFFSRSFTVSLSQEYPAGPYSVSFGLQPCNIVETSPALQLFDIRSEEFYDIFDQNLTSFGPSHIVDDFIQELRDIYMSRKGSPFDVDEGGNNIAHKWLKACLGYFRYEEESKSSDMVDAICKMLTYLADIGVPITASNFSQSNVLTLSIKTFHNFWILPRIYKMIVNHDPGYYSADVAYSRRLSAGLDYENGERWVRHLNVLCDHPEICEDIGFSELFLAAIEKDSGRLRKILARQGYALDISETDLYGRNILHVSSNWPDGLRLLLQRQDVLPLLDMTVGPFPSLKPLDYALFYSRVSCNGPDQWTDCINCTCSATVQLLLEADCNVTVGYGRPETLTGCSLKARKLFFAHLKDRRQRLQNIAASILPKETLRKYGVAENSLPDKTATMLWNELQKTKEHPNQLIVGLGKSLKPCSDDFSYIDPEGFFGFPHHLQVAVLALDYGLAPKDESGVPTLLSSRHIIPDRLSMRSRNISMKYPGWLLQFDLNLELCLEPFRFSVLHRLAVSIGNWIVFPSKRAFIQTYDPVPELQDLETLLPAICDSKAQCNIPCPCSSGMFTRPAAHILPTMLLQDYRNSRPFSSNLGDQIELVVRFIDLLNVSNCSPGRSYMARCAIHILTMMSLGVRHLPICLSGGYARLEDLYCEEDWRELLDEDRELIDQLEALDEEFGEAFDRQHVPIAEFLSGYWLTRMEQVIEELNKPITGNDRYGLLEAGVVLEEDDTDGSECYI